MIESTKYQIIPKKKPVISQWFNLFAPIILFGVIITSISSDTFGDDTVILMMILLLAVGSIMINMLEGYIFRQRWQALANRTGLDYYPKSRSLFTQPTLLGNRHGYATKLATFSSGLGKFRRQYTRFTILFPFENAESLTIKKRRLFDGQDVKVDMEDVDKTFTIRTSAPHMAQRIFQSDRLRQGLFDLVGQTKSMSLVVEEDQLVYTERDRILDLEYLSALSDFLHKISEYVHHSSKNTSE